MQDGHSYPSPGHKTRSKRWLFDLDSRSIMRPCLVNISDMNVQATGIAVLHRVATTLPVSGSSHSVGSHETRPRCHFRHNVTLYRQADACRSPILSFMTAWSIASQLSLRPGKVPQGTNHGMLFEEIELRLQLIEPVHFSRFKRRRCEVRDFSVCLLLQ